MDVLPSNHTPYKFRNKSDFQKIRNSIVKKMKNFCSFFNLSKKTYFLSLDYFDRICSKMLGFEMQDLLQISQLAIILASKFHEPQNKTREIKLYLGLTSNYSQDELFLLRLLGYDLFTHTSYDILIDIMHTGFLFNDEKFSKKKMNFLYGKMENILYFFSETKLYIEMTNKGFALAIIGLIRETLGLEAFNDIIKNTFMSQYTDVQIYYACLKKLRKCFKILDDNNHSDSNTDENSDNNSDGSENSSEIKNQKKEK